MFTLTWKRAIALDAICAAVSFAVAATTKESLWWAFLIVGCLFAGDLVMGVGFPNRYMQVAMRMRSKLGGRARL